MLAITEMTQKEIVQQTSQRQLRLTKWRAKWTSHELETRTGKTQVTNSPTTWSAL